jgi:hypothetical protein
MANQLMEVIVTGKGFHLNLNSPIVEKEVVCTSYIAIPKNILMNFNIRKKSNLE